MAAALGEGMGHNSAMERTDQIEPVHGPYTWDDFIKLDEDDLRELIDGELVEVEVPGLPHEHIVAHVVTELRVWAKQNGGRVFPSGVKVYISERRGVMPDAQYYAKDHPAAQRPVERRVRRSPDLAVEVLSPSSRRIDRVVKLGYYASVGTLEYWLIDPEAQTLDRYLLKKGHYILAASLSGADVFRPETLPGFELSLGEIWPTEEDQQFYDVIDEPSPDLPARLPDEDP
ncbi:Uma2 family endonuclease [Pendulispora rubella]|uniref:Uma2 family endonuclease n=1 Tax=Pendulispora rubella TaxID=2741070 RepID=A0ABZ2KYH2_9BACT